MNLTSAPQIRKLLLDHGLRPKKRLGQNFLIDRNVLNKIVEASGAGPGVDVLEVGPGLGVVTKALAESGAHVVCVEMDRELAPILADILSDEPGVEIIIEDVLKLDLPQILGGRAEGKWTVVGNLPYYITSPIIIKLLESRQYISSIVLMVQREVAQRIKADAGTGDYGSFSIFVQYYCEIESVLRVSRNVFFPVPDVDSEIIRLQVRETPAVDVRDEELFFRIVRAAFGKRRKTLYNALSSSELGWKKERTAAILNKAGIDGTRRGETLNLQEYADLANVSMEV